MSNVETAGCCSCSLECRTLVFIAGGVANFALAACWALMFFAGAKEGVVKGMLVWYFCFFFHAGVGRPGHGYERREAVDSCLVIAHVMHWLSGTMLSTLGSGADDVSTHGAHGWHSSEHCCMIMLQCCWVIVASCKMEWSYWRLLLDLKSGKPQMVWIQDEMVLIFLPAGEMEGFVIPLCLNLMVLLKHSLLVCLIWHLCVW